MMVWVCAVHLAPGEVAVYSERPYGVLDVGRYPEGTEGAEPVVSALRAAGFDSAPRGDIMAWKHAKLLSNLPGALQALGGPFDRARADGLVEEGLRVCEAAGLSAAPTGELLDRVSGVSQAPIAGRSRPGGSLWQSVHRGSGLEIDWLNGYVVRLGERHGVDTPENRAIVEAVKAHQAARGRSPLPRSLP